MVTDANLKNEFYINTQINNDEKIASRFEYVIDSPYIYLMAGNVPAVITASLNTKSIIKYHLLNGIFSRSSLISDQSFVLRSFDSSIHSADQIFIKGDMATNLLVKENNISERHGDIGISTDGLLHFDKKDNLLIYVFFYRNKFISMDTNLYSSHMASTIDTLNVYQAKGGASVSGNQITYTNISPSRFINLYSCVSEGKLYNNSSIKADNEQGDDFEENSVIDIYNTKTGYYMGSFYIPDHDKEKLLSFRITDQKLIVLYNNLIALYRLSF